MVGTLPRDHPTGRGAIGMGQAAFFLHVSNNLQIIFHHDFAFMWRGEYSHPNTLRIEH